MTPSRLGAALGSSLLLLPVYLAVAGTVLYRSAESAESFSVSDAVEYASGARRLVELGRYEVVVNDQVHPPRYPFGFPAFFLAPVYSFAQGDGAGIHVVFGCALVTLALVWGLCRKALPGVRGAVAAGLALPVLLHVFWFYEQSRLIMSDVPLLMLGTIGLALFERALAQPRARVFLLAGLVVGLSVSIRMTGLALALPFCFALWRERRASHAIALGGPIAVAVAAQLAYNQAVFGHALFTGYHYWLVPKLYALGLGHLGENAVELVNPFAGPPHKREPGDLWIGPAVLGWVAVAAIACRGFRPEAWARTRTARTYLLTAALPIVAFHLFYPYHSARFALLAHVLVLTLGAVWGVALLDRVPTAALAVAGVVAVALTPHWIPPDPAGRDWYRPEALREADARLERDACLITTINAMYAQAAFVDGTRRCVVPLKADTAFAGWRVGAHGEERRRIFRFSAEEQPEEIEALLRAGRPVYLEMLQAEWNRGQAVQSALLERFDSEVVWERLRRPAIVRLRLRAAR